MSFDSWSDEQKKKEKKSQKSTKALSFDEWSDNQVINISTEDINNFITDTQSFFDNSEKIYNNMSWGNASQSFKDIQNKYRDLETRGGRIQTWLDKNKDTIDAETYNNLSSTLKEINKGTYSVYDNVRERKKLYSSFETEDDFNSWYEEYKRQEEERKAILEAEDYDYYSQLGASAKNPENIEDVADTGLSIFGHRIFGKEGEDIGNVVTMSRDNADYIGLMEVNGGNTADYGLKYIYSLMTDEEVGIYNYYLGKYGKERAGEYLASIEDTLNQRHGGQMAENVLGNRLLEVTFAAGAGLEQFTSGVRNLDNLIMGTEADPTTATQYADAEIRQNLGGFMGGVYDTTKAVTNMFPSILAGALGGPTVGKVVMGTSIAGNSYAEMKNLGYNEWRSRGYAALVTTAEMVLQGLLGGISSLGGQHSLSSAITKFVSKFDNALARVAISVPLNMGSEGLEEAIQTVLEPAFKAFMAGEDFEAPEWEEILYSGLIGALSAGVLEGVPSVIGGVNKTIEAKNYKNVYGGDAQALITESLEIDPNNEHAQRMQAKLDKGKDLSGSNLQRLVAENETAMYDQDVAAIKSSAVERLKSLGETSNVEQIAEALAKQVIGEELTFSEKRAIKNSKYGQRVANELNTDNIKSGEYSSAWAEKIGTNRINAEEYSRALAEAEVDIDNTTAEDTQTVQSPALTSESFAQQEKTTPVTENAPVEKSSTESEIKAFENTPESTETNSSLTIEDASKKYGAQAQAMIHTYNAGQDVEKYDKAYKIAYDMGMSGVALSYAMNSDSTSYLSDKQRELAYEAGRAASDTAAKEQDAKNKKAVNGKTGRKIGTVKGEGVTISDLRKSFNDTQNTAYKILSTYAEATGIDIVLYKSEANADGNFEGAQGKFKWSEDTIYIDVNAGLTNIKSVNDLAKYAILRTFSHEFTHFVEKYNPIWYNEFRKVVFDTLTERGENVNDLIELKLSQDSSGKMTYEKASREVVAEAMTDILPDANFVETLATKHKNIFEKLLDKLKDFLADLKAYFNTLGHNRSREANALKEQVGDAVHYVDNIVKLFDKIALAAVENYQSTVAIEEADPNGLTDDEINSIVTYKSGGSYTLNAKLREGIELDEYEQEIVNNLDKALEKLPTYKGVVYRNIEFDGLGDKAARDAYVAGHIIGEPVFYDAYTSSSTVTDGYVLDGKFVVHHIIQSENGRNLAGYGSDAESEVLFSRNAYYVTDRIEYDSNGTPTIYLTEVANGQQKEIVANVGRGTEESIVGRTMELGEGRIQKPDTRGEEKSVKRSLSDDSRGQQKEPSISKTPEVQRLPTQNTGDGEVQSVIPEGNTIGNSEKQGDLRGVQAEVSEDIEKQYKKISQWLKPARDVYMFTINGSKYISDGGLTVKTTDAIIERAKTEFAGKAFDKDLPVAITNALDNATTLLTNAPVEGTLGVNTVYSFNLDGKTNHIFDKKKLSMLDGNLLYMGDFAGVKMIKAVDTDGNLVGFLLPIKTKSDVQNIKPSKLKSFSKKMQATINATANNTKEVKQNGENADNRKTVQQSDTDRQGDSRLLDEVETSDVQGDVQGGDSVGDSVERGQETRRDDVRDGSGTGTRSRSGVGDNQSGDIRRDDELTPEAAEKLHNEVSEQIAQQSTEKPKGRDFVIGDSLDLPNGEKARYKANIEAIRLVKKLEAESRYATEAEQVILSKYVGWGGLANAFDERKGDWSKEYKELKELLSDEEYSLARGSTLNAHYTDISVIKAMYDGLKQLGFNGGRMLEPSSGVGNFVGAMPTDMSAKVKSWTMVELDGITGLIAKYLYPNADVRIQGFETANIPNNYMDVAISNVPFGNYPITDKAYPKKVTSAIHNYFFAKSLDKVRPGGILMFITSSYTMNSKDETVRRYIMQRADLLGAIRLPDSAFKGNAGTEVVTDILILKKRAANTTYAGEDFLESPWGYPVKGNYSGAYINNYFKNHPEMVLGTASMDGSMYRGASLTYKALEGRGSLADQIREAFKSIKGKMDYPVQKTPEKTNFAVEKASKKTKQNGYVSKDGKIYQNKDGELIEQTVNAKVAERIIGMLEIRDAAKALMTAQQQGLKETEIKKARTTLNKLYDAYVKKNGYLNAPANKSAFNEDPDRYSLFALENWNPDKKTATKSDIFTKNTIAPNRTVTSAKDVSEGLIVSVNQTGGVDVPLIAALTAKSVPDVTRELIDSRKVFKNRDGVLETAETYLSGNVRAKLRDAEALVPMDNDYQKNVEALKSVMPEDVSYQDIFVNPGTPWIPSSVYSDFAAYMLGGRNTEWRQDIDVTRNPDTGNFTVELKSGYLKHNASNTQKWGTPRRSFLDLFDAMLNSKSVVVKDKLDDGSFVVNKDATAAANEKIENITKEFQEWLWKDEARRTELATLYNEVFNSIVTPKYNGDNLTVNGANAMKPLRPHQRNAVQRVISSGGNTLLAHKVGAGKTYEMAAAAMKLKELGLVKKPMFAVPKSLVAQWGNEFIDFFPTAKLLVAEATDFTPTNRKVFMNRVANGDYDAVIVSYEQFEKLPMSDDFTRELYQEQINSIVAAIEEAKAEKGAKAMSVKDLEKKRKSLQAKIDKLTDKAKDEGNIDFEQLGVDSLFIDEAHNFKNLFYTTSMTNVSGLGNKDGSKRAFDLYTKVRYLQKLNGGKGIVFATATPVMNSMSEMYIMQKYLQPDLLEQLGLSTFDAWAKQFGEVVNGVEIKPSGQGYRVKQSFSRFKNMSELQLLFRNFADVLTDIPGLKIPKMKGGAVNVVVCEPGQFQKDFMKELEKRADNIKNVDPSVDNMLKITSDGRKISYTQRMIDPTLPYEEGCKIYRCADNVVKVYNESTTNKGTQLIFCDMATPKGKSKTETTETDDGGMDMESAKLYDDIKARLIQNGIPAKEIAFIHEADTDQKKKKLFADVNDGKVRVLIGSTGKMGVGMNAQKRVVAIHHLDAPWRPGDVEQRNGRAYRQGNINEEVECFTYVTEGSFDARLWDILERKQNFINQIMNGENIGRETEDTGEVTLSAAEVKALASGSPLIMEQVQLDTDIKKLESLQRAHRSSVANARQRLEADKGKIETLTRWIDSGTSDMAATVDTYSDGKFALTVGKQKFTEKKDAGVALMAEATAKAVDTGYTTIGSFAGFNVRVVKTSEGIKGLISGKQSYSFNTYPNNTTFMINHIISVVESISEKVNMWNTQLKETKADMAEQEKLISEPFAKQAELDSKRARYKEVMDILNPKEEQSVDNVDDTVQEQSREYLGDYDETIDLNKNALRSVSSSVKLSVKEYSLQEIQSVFKSININPELDVLFDKVYDFCVNADIRVSVEPRVIDKNAVGHGGVARGNKIVLSQEYFNDTKVSIERKAKTILHEMIHTSTVYAMEAYEIVKKGGKTEMMSKDTYKACEKMFTVYLKIKTDPLFAKEYGITNAKELVAELANQEFVEKLKRTYLSAWDKILEGICELFGINKSFSAYDKLKKSLDVLLEHPDNQLRQSYYEYIETNSESPNDYSDYTIQEQQRTETLTDYEVLDMAANEIKVNDLSEAEQNALGIFQERLANLKKLQNERVEQGRLYKEQQFGAKPNRAEAEKTLNRMKVLDGQIQRASSDVLSVKEKEVLKRVLKKARKVVELEERQHGQEMLNRWRDRRNNAAAIKKYRDRVRGDVDELTNWILHPNNKDIVKHVPDALKNTVIPFLSSINFMSKRALKGGAATKADEVFMSNLKKLNSAMKTNIELNGLYSGYNDLPPNFMENLQRFIDSTEALVKKNSGELVINQMTSAELKELSQVVRTLKKYIMQVNRFHNNAMYEHVYEAGENSIEYLKDLGNAGETGEVSNFVLWQQIRPAYAFERFGNGGMAIYDGLRRGQAKLAFNTKEIQSFTEKAYTEKEVKAWENEIKSFGLGKDLVKMPVSYIMAFYELSKDPEALEHINGEGIRVATYTHKGKKISDTGHVLTVGEFNQIINSLTDRQKEVADSLQKYMAQQGGKWGNYVSVARFGEELFTNPNYFPINSDGRHLQSTVDEHPSASSLYALLNMSFTKSRKEGANNRIVIYSIFDVFANHMASMAQYNAMALPILDALKWFNYQQVFIDDEGNKHIGDSVRERMDRAFGVPEETKPGRGKSGYAQNFVINIIKAFNGTEAQGTPYDSLGLKSLHSYNVAQVAYNLRVVIQQPLAITRAGMLLDYKSIIKGMKLNPSAIKKNIEEMQKYSGIAAWKALGFYDVNISRGLSHIIKHDSTAMDKISDVGMWGAEKADLLTWAGIWSAAKEEVTKKQHLTPESEGFYEAVTKLFEDVIYKTQVVDSILTKNEFMRDKGTFARLVGSFMSEPTTNASMLIDAYDKYHLDRQRGMTKQQAWKKNSKIIGRVLYVYGVGAVLLAAVQAVADALRDDDEYEEWYEKWLEAFGGNLVDELMPFNKLPIMSDFYDLAKELLSIFGFDTYGNPPQSVFMQWYDSLIKGTEIINDKITGADTNYTWYGGIYKLLQAVSGMSGLPMASATREIITAWNNTVGAFAPSLKVKTYESSELSQIRYAYEDGYLTDEEAMAQILEKGLADNENEAYFIIQGWEAGEGYSRYDKVYDAVRNGESIDEAMDELISHGYTEKDVLSRVKSQIGEWYQNGEISKAQATNMLTKYFDMSGDEITATVNKWSSKVVTGINYEDIDDEFMNGNITAARAIEMYVRYGSMTREKATEKVTVLEFVKENPNAEGISYAAVNGYKTYCEPYGVPVETFYDAWKYNSNTDADVDNNGNAISGSKKAKVLAYINSLNLSAAQKDSLYFAFGWAESKLYEAPWR